MPLWSFPGTQNSQGSKWRASVLMTVPGKWAAPSAEGGSWVLFALGRQSQFYSLGKIHREPRAMSFWEFHFLFERWKTGLILIFWKGVLEFCLKYHLGFFSFFFFKKHFPVYRGKHSEHHMKKKISQIWKQLIDFRLSYQNMSWYHRTPAALSTTDLLL